MSLVAYGSSDESSDEEVNSNEDSAKQLSKFTETKITKNDENKQITEVEKIESGIAKNVEITQEARVQIPSTENGQDEKLSISENRSRINLPIPKTIHPEKVLVKNKSDEEDFHNSTINFNVLPQPKHKEIIETTIEDGDYFPPPKTMQEQIAKSEKKEKGPVKISIPSLSDVSINNYYYFSLIYYCLNIVILL